MSDDRSFKNYRDLIAWQKSMDLTSFAYELTKKLPKEELYGLSNQIRRSAVSVPSNIAEGHARKSTNEFLRFLYIALGSLAELETQFLLAERLNYLSSSDIAATMRHSSEVGRLINGLINSLNK